ncbi:hypothetical protein B0H12DRAFT_1080389 [Mycena haematopus]|nr:hypothetical protein B0H12DRAFT_1080384 [Mycena haematopus]KAJ7205139.1 hypothetical protein B0H12DRAFT_1080389 [Mycena haematopus]
MAHYQQIPPLAVPIQQQAVAPALSETTVAVHATADMHAEALAVDELAPKIAAVSAETDSGEQARQKVTQILIEWNHRRQTELLLYGQPDRRIFLTKRHHRFYLQDYVGDYMRMS